MSDSKLSARLASIYYSPRGCQKGIKAIQNLSDTAKVSENVFRGSLKKQAIWQIYLPASRHIPRPKLDIATPNEVHQADLLFLPHDRLPRGRKTYKYALTIIDVSSRYNEAKPLATKKAKEVAEALSEGLSGQNSSRSTPGASSWAQSISCSQNTMSRSGEVVWTSTGTRGSWNDEQRVCICIEELTTLSIQRLHLIVKKRKPKIQNQFRRSKLCAF